MKPGPWVDMVQTFAIPAGAAFAWVVRGRRLDQATTRSVDATAADTISQAAARTVQSIAEQMNRLEDTVRQQGEDLVALRAERDHDTAAVRILTEYAVQVGAWARMISARFLELTGQQAPPPPRPPVGLVPEPDAADDVTVQPLTPITPDAVGGTTWTTPPTPRPGS